MKSFKKVALIVTMLFCLLFCITTTAQTSKIALSKTKITMNFGKTTTLSLKNAPGKIAWYSSKPSVAYVTNGKLEARSTGTATITAKCYGKSYKCSVKVISGETTTLKKSGKYTSKTMVAKYIHKYKKLPSNFITKSAANDLGWTSGSLIPYAKYKCIGGDIYSNYEETLPSKQDRIYYECDIDTLGALSRGAKRIVYSNDGLVYYTNDHYETFKQLY